MKTTLLLLLLLPLTSLAQVGLDGKTEQELLSLKGPPNTKASLGKKTIYTWDDATVTVISGKVTEYRMKKAASEPPAVIQRTEPAKSSQTTPTVPQRQQSPEEQKLADAQKRANYVTQLANVKQSIQTYETRIDKFNRQSAFEKRPVWDPLITQEQADIYKAQLEISKAQLVQLENNPPK